MNPSRSQKVVAICSGGLTLGAGTYWFAAGNPAIEEERLQPVAVQHLSVVDADRSGRKASRKAREARERVPNSARRVRAEQKEKKSERKRGSRTPIKRVKKRKVNPAG